MSASVQFFNSILKFFQITFKAPCIFLTHTFFIWRDCQNFNFHQHEICLTYAWFLCKKGARTYLLVSFVTLPDYLAKYPKHGKFSIHWFVCCKAFITLWCIGNVQGKLKSVLALCCQSRIRMRWYENRIALGWKCIIRVSYWDT